MFGARTLNRHAALMNRMAETLGVSLEDALRRGKLSSQEWRDALISCAGCDDPTGCVDWLSEQDAPEECAGCAGKEGPSFCNNKLMMARLREVMAKAEPVGGQGALEMVKE